MAAKKKGPIVDWGLLSKIAFVVGVVMLGWVLVPTAQCTVSEMNRTSVGSAEVSDGSTSDLARASEATGFFSSFFGSIGTCFGRAGFAAAAAWQKMALAGGFGLALLFWIINNLGPSRSKFG